MLTCNFGTSSEVLSRGVFYTLSSSDIVFTGICRVVSPGAHAVTPHRTLVLK